MRKGYRQPINTILNSSNSRYLLTNFKSISFKKMKNKYVLDQLLAAHALAVVTLQEADRVFYRQRRTIEDQIGLTHGVIGGV